MTGIKDQKGGRRWFGAAVFARLCAGSVIAVKPSDREQQTKEAELSTRQDYRQIS